MHTLIVSNYWTLPRVEKSEFNLGIPNQNHSKALKAFKIILSTAWRFFGDKNFLIVETLGNLNDKTIARETFCRLDLIVWVGKKNARVTQIFKKDDDIEQYHDPLQNA